MRTHYEILGLPDSASTALIKRRYRELVRKYHPDVAADKVTSHLLFLRINEAYEVLKDPVRRKAYDETLAIEAMIQKKKLQYKQSTTAAAAPPPAPPHAPRNISQMLKDAQFAFIQKRFAVALELCKVILRTDPRNAKACVMLADIYRIRGKTGAAIKYYNFAVQFDPADSDSQKKLMKLMSKQISSQPPVARVRHPAEVLAVNAMWWSVAFLLILLIKVYPGAPISWLGHYVPQVSKWSWNTIGFLAGASAIAGALLSVNGLLRHPDNELVFENPGSNWAIVPVGILLLIGSGFFFIGAAAFYILFGALQGSLSRSVMTIFGAVVVLVSLAALMCEPTLRMQVLLFGGNVAFFSSLFGWYTGAALKPLGAE